MLVIIIQNYEILMNLEKYIKTMLDANFINKSEPSPL